MAHQGALFTFGNLSAQKCVLFPSFTREGAQKPTTTQRAGTTCSTFKVVSAVLISVLTVLGGHTLPSVSQAIHALFPIELSKGLNCPGAKLDKTSWKY